MLMPSSAETDRRRRSRVLAALFFLPAVGCTDDGGDGGPGSETSEMPGDGDPGDGDPGDGDPGDGDPGDGDPGDGDPATGDCGPYPAGPYKWFDNNVVPADTTLPAMYGPNGEETTLNMGEVHDNCKEVKALVIAFGAND